MDFMKICPKCGYTKKDNTIGDIAQYCALCKTPYISTDANLEDSGYLEAFRENYVTFRKEFEENLYKKFVYQSPEFDQGLFNAREEYDNKYIQKWLKEENGKNNPSCPHCGSTAISANKKGFGLGKAAVGGLLTGGAIGLLGGFIGSKKVEITCLNCGKHWTAGKR